MKSDNKEYCLRDEFIEQIIDLIPASSREEVIDLIKQFSADVYDAGFCDGIELGKEKGYREAADDFRTLMASAELMSKPVGVMH